MECCFCSSKNVVLMTNGKYICLQCAEKKGLATCTKHGQVIADPEFHCDYICNDCIYTEEENK